MTKNWLAVSTILAVAALAWVAAGQTAPQPAGAGAAAPEQRSAHLLDRGAAAQVTVTKRGGTPPPMGPTVISFPGGSPAAVPVPTGFGFLGAGLPTAAPGGFVGNLFVPGAGYPPTFLTAGGVPGFDVTGVYAWHLAPTAAASLIRILGAAVVGVPSTAFAPSGPAVAVASAPFSTGTPAPSGLLSAPGFFAPLRVSPATTPPGPSGIFCGLAVGAPGFTPIVAGPAGNGLGGATPTPQPSPLRIVPVPLATGAIAAPLPASPAAYIAGCFADSSTTPVELMAFGVE